MNPADPNDWKAIIDASAYTVQGMIYAFALNYSTVQAWFHTDVDKRSKPRAKTIEKMTPIMTKIQATKPIPKNPSHGYVTDEQWERFTSLGIGPEKDKLLEQIRVQNKNLGKIYV